MEGEALPDALVHEPEATLLLRLIEENLNDSSPSDNLLVVPIDAKAYSTSSSSQVTCRLTFSNVLAVTCTESYDDDKPQIPNPSWSDLYVIVINK